jgi:hypothetical protein
LEREKSRVEKRVKEKGLSNNIEFVGHSNLGGRIDCGNIVGHKVGSKQYIYTVSVLTNGVNILDTTDPANPEYVAWKPAPTSHTENLKVQVGDNLMAVMNSFFPTRSGGLTIRNEDRLRVCGPSTQYVNS